MLSSLKVENYSNFCFIFSLYFLNLIFILHWSIVDLPYCVSFRCIANCFYIHISVLFHILFPFFTTGYGVEFLVLYSRALLTVIVLSTGLYTWCSKKYFLDN